MTKEKKDLFDWTLALIIAWQIECLKKEHKKESIDLEFFNTHNTLSLTTLLTFPYFLASATLEHKGFHWYGTWVVIRYNHTNILVPAGYQQYVVKLYANSSDEKPQLEHLNHSYEDKIPEYDGYALHEQNSYMQILLDGLKYVKFCTSNNFLGFIDEKYVVLMYKNSAVNLTLIYYPKPKHPEDILKKLSDRNVRHAYSKEHAHI